MTEKITTLDGARLDRMLAELEDELTAQGVSTLLRLRMTTLIRELVDALRELNDESGLLRCVVSGYRTVELQYRGGQGALAPDLRMTRRLARSSCMEGVSASFGPGVCVITAKTRTEG